MAVLLPVSNAQYSALYDGVLKLEVKGDIPGVVLNYEIRRDPWAGGLHYSVVGFYGGRGKSPPTQAVTINYTEVIHLPMPNFNSKSVLVETADGTTVVEIKYTGLIPTPKSLDDPAKSSQQLPPVVLPPINLYLPGGTPGKHLCEVTALLHRGWDVDVDYDPTVLSIWRVDASPNRVRYFLTWLKTPEDPDRPSLFQVTTRRALQEASDETSALSGGTIQGYGIHYVLLHSEK